MYRELTKKELIVLIAEILIMSVTAYLSLAYLYPKNLYLRSVALAGDGAYDDAVSTLRQLGEYEDSSELITEYTYLSAVTLMDAEKYSEAKEVFASLSGYKDSKTLIRECNYLTALNLLSLKQYGEACGYLISLNGYKDSEKLYYDAVYELSKEEYKNGEFDLFYDHFSIVCSTGLFSYDILDKPDIRKAASLVDTTSVNIFGDLSGSDSGFDSYTGEAAIYKITPEAVYFLSAKHVLNMLNGENVRITFYDGTVTETLMDAYVSEKEDSDLGLFRVDTKDIPIELLVTLKEINYYPEYYSTLKKGNPAFILSNYWYARSDLMTETTFMGLDVQKLSEGSYPAGSYLAFDRCSVEGQSGSPVFDAQGRCLAIASGYYYYEIDGNITFTIDCHSRLDESSELLSMAMGNPSS
ncbi:MAG: serine protease [Lachnospiraceae bacterium]|nr:serine protease [Lachnospiraceae bacterium]